MLLGGTGGVSRKWSGGNGQVLLLWGCLQEGWGGGGDGTGRDGKGQSSRAHSTLNVWLRGTQIEGSIGGWKAGDGNTKRRVIIIINNGNHWCLTIL